MGKNDFNHGRRRGYYARRAGFTLTEILFAVLIVGIVLAMTMPMIKRGTEKMKISKSVSNLRTIGIFILDYHNNSDGYGATHTNGGKWYNPPDGNYTKKYWGSMYGGGEEFKSLFHSPLTWETLRHNTDGSREDGHVYVDYGFNGVAAKWTDDAANFENAISGEGRDFQTYINPAMTIWAHDHSEPMIDGDGDVPCYAFAKDQNTLNRGHPNFNALVKDRENSEAALMEIFRNLNHSCVLWVDGHVSKIPIDGKWEPVWYTGEFEEAQKVWEAKENGKYTQPRPFDYTGAYLQRL